MGDCPSARYLGAHARGGGRGSEARDAPGARRVVDWTAQRTPARVSTSPQRTPAPAARLTRTRNKHAPILHNSKRERGVRAHPDDLHLRAAGRTVECEHFPCHACGRRRGPMRRRVARTHTRTSRTPVRRSSPCQGGSPRAPTASPRAPGTLRRSTVLAQKLGNFQFEISIRRITNKSRLQRFTNVHFGLLVKPDDYQPPWLSNQRFPQCPTSQGATSQRRNHRLRPRGLIWPALTQQLASPTGFS